MRPGTLCYLAYSLNSIFRTVGDGSTQSLDVDGKWSSTIFTELMELGGGPRWEEWKKQRTEAGLPLVDIPKPKPKPEIGRAHG